MNTFKISISAWGFWVRVTNFSCGTFCLHSSEWKEKEKTQNCWISMNQTIHLSHNHWNGLCSQVKWNPSSVARRSGVNQYRKCNWEKAFRLKSRISSSYFCFHAIHYLQSIECDGVRIGHAVQPCGSSLILCFMHMQFQLQILICIGKNICLVGRNSQRVNRVTHNLANANRKQNNNETIEKKALRTRRSSK